MPDTGKPHLDRLSMCGVTLPGLSLSEQATLSAELGCRGMGVFHPIVPKNTTADAVRRVLDSHGLQATICVPKPFTLLPRFGFDAPTGRWAEYGERLPGSLQAMSASLEWLAQLRPDCVLVIPGAQGAMSQSEAWDKACEALGRLCEVAHRLDLRLCIEPVHPRFASDFSIVATIDAALQMISDISAENLGVLIEIFHIWDHADRFDQIGRAAGRITGVQLSDSPAFPHSVIDRLPPGDGAADIVAIIQAIEASGYKGWYDIEVPFGGGARLETGPHDPSNRARVGEFARRCVNGSLAAMTAAAL